MTIWFTSDHHFGHKNIIEYSVRPFKALSEMHEWFITNWNKNVKPGDVVYHLGDFAFLWPEEVPNLVKSLNGQKHLIRGNHDRFLKQRGIDFGFVWTGEYKRIKVGLQKIILCHYPFLTWDSRHHGSWHLHGHSHGSLPIDMGSKRLDVGVDAVAKLLGEKYNERFERDYRPISYEEVEEQMKTRGINPVDYHETREEV